MLEELKKQVVRYAQQADRSGLCKHRSGNFSIRDKDSGRICITPTGMYSIGGNPEAAKLSGIPVNRYKIIAYFLSAVFSAIGGICLAARVGTAQVSAGDAFLMPAVAAAFIGYSVGGAGKPNAIGTLIGAVLVGILENGLIMTELARPLPYISRAGEKNAVFYGLIAQAFAGRISPKEAMQQAEEQLRSLQD